MLEVMWFSDGQLHWDFYLRRPLQDWEEASVDLLWDMLYSTNMWHIGDDKLC